ncbi:hypothetical protein C8A00DRAFT_40104 [Chaetomidium leptoderma]|uniref:Uncharacterized protein n=1 Tax=Chaetomidium leptoderma TaxID=669021 RepID=A0AAN6VTT4_9PEZI|nr:hypothetical protein C8A00DRAFT_40104 [Chaetomidium leptoderma]
MAGLASSRHAPLSRRPPKNWPTATNLTVTPAPTGGGGIGIADIPHIRRSASPAGGPNAGANDLDAPRRPPPSGPPHELARYAKIIRRLQWKLPFLAQGYRQAVDRIGVDPAAVSEAELMFKLDFFEYYMLIERALVHLLGVFGVDIPRRGYGGRSSSSHTQPQRQRHDLTTKDGGGGGGLGNNNNNKGLVGSVWRDDAAAATRHRYHANVLGALDSAENPLHGTLGTGEVRVQLGRAKDLRNRWKTAGDDETTGYDHHPDRISSSSSSRRSSPPVKSGTGAGTPEREWRTRRMAAPLDSYRLEHMLEVIFNGFDEAFRIAEGYVRGGSEWRVEGDTDMMEVVDWAAEEDEDQWEFMVDAMDWEAV